MKSERQLTAWAGKRFPLSGHLEQYLQTAALVEKQMAEMRAMRDGPHAPHEFQFQAGPLQ